jgi:hypothetical protein
MFVANDDGGGGFNGIHIHDRFAHFTKPVCVLIQDIFEKKQLMLSIFKYHN